eukprot:scaffold681435_cov57-Prasinocladus_malaysianus.AAC.2
MPYTQVGNKGNDGEALTVLTLYCMEYASTPISVLMKLNSGPGWQRNEPGTAPFALKANAWWYMVYNTITS